MSERWYSPAEIAAMKLPGMPHSKRGVNLYFSNRQGHGRDRKTQGGGREYPLSALPPAAQQAIVSKSVTAQPTLLPAPTAPQTEAQLKAYQRDKMMARAVVVGHLEQLAVLHGITYAQAVNAFLAAQMNGELDPALLDAALKGNARLGKAGRTICRATLFNWRGARIASKGNIVALAPAAVQEEPVPEWAETFLKLRQRPMRPNITDVLAQWPEDAPAAPTYDQARRFVRRLDSITKHAGRIGPRALRSLKAYIARDVANLWPGAVFVGDGHTFKAEIAHPIHGRPFRPEVTAILDVYTRRWVGWSVALAENTWSVADALRHAFTTATVCDVWYYDNGAGANNRFWDDNAAGMIARQEITKLNSAPWSSQARGVIERFHGSTLHPMARRLPTYVGERMDKEARDRAYKITRADIKATGTSKLLMQWPDFLAWMDREQAAYNAAPHTTLPRIVDSETGKRRHMSPQECWDAAVAGGWEASPIGAEEARDLFMPAVTRTAHRATVKLFGNTYFLPALEAVHGEIVVVGYDIHDASRVRVSLADGRVIGIAECDGNKRDYIPIPFAEQARQKRVAGKLKRLDAHRDTALAELGPTVIEHRFRPPEPVIEVTERELAGIDAIAAEIEQAAADPDTHLSPADREHRDKIRRFKRARDILARIAEDENGVPREDAIWVAKYVNLSEYRTFKMIIEDFGEDALAE